MDTACHLLGSIIDMMNKHVMRIQDIHINGYQMIPMVLDVNNALKLS